MTTKKATTEMKVHPDADIFPMLPKDELEELAADIKANGLIHPIVTAKVDGEEMLIDGRNRLAACKLAKVKPRFMDLNGADPKAYIVSGNINRRHMTKGQRAMAVAMVYPEPAKPGRKKKGSKIEPLSATRECWLDVHKGYLSQARYVLKHSPKQALEVVRGDLSLEKAHVKALADKVAADLQKKQSQELRDYAPDLADKVAEDVLSFEDAWGAYKSRINDEVQVAKNQRISAFQSLAEATNGLKLLSGGESLSSIDEWFADDRTGDVAKREFSSYLPQGMAGLKKDRKKIKDGFTVLKAFLESL